MGDRQLQSDMHHIQAIHSHPCRTICLIEVASSRKWFASIKYTDIVQAEETALEDIVAIFIFLVDPPGKIEHQFEKDAFEEEHITFITPFVSVYLKDTQGCPGMYRWIDITKVPLIRRQFPIRIHIPVMRQLYQL